MMVACNQAPGATVLAAALPHLQCLTFLAVSYYFHDSGLRRIDFPPISAALQNLHQLQVLEIGSYLLVPESSLAHLPVSLQSLQISSIDYSISASSAPYLYYS